MPYNSRVPAGTTSAWNFPHARALAFTVLGALIILFLLRHAFGSVRVEAGVR